MANRRRAAAGLAAGALLAAGAGVASTRPTKMPFRRLDPAVTPGATNPAVTPATIGATICVARWTDTIRPPSSYTTGLKRRQLAALRYRDQDLSHYEEDHAIPLELGGAPRDPANLWVEPWPQAHNTDHMEDRLHAAVCAGKLDLEVAQQAIIAYKHRHG